MHTDKIEARLAPLRRGIAQHTRLATAQADPATARAPPVMDARVRGPDGVGPLDSEKLRGRGSEMPREDEGTLWKTGWRKQLAGGRTLARMRHRVGREAAEKGITPDSSL